MKYLILYSALVLTACSSSYRTQFSRPLPSTVATEIKYVGEVPFRVVDIDTDEDGAADIRFWYVTYGASQDTALGLINLQRSKYPMILEKLKNGWYSYYREIDMDLDGEVDAAYVLEGSEWKLIWQRTKEE